MNKQLCIECLKTIVDIKFSESIEKNNTIGYITDGNRRIKVLYSRDNIGQYLSLVYAAVKKENYQTVSQELNRRIINGRHEVCNDMILLCSIIPILDAQFLPMQIKHALLEIWDMNNIVEYAPV